MMLHPTALRSMESTPMPSVRKGIFLSQLCSECITCILLEVLLDIGWLWPTLEASAPAGYHEVREIVLRKCLSASTFLRSNCRWGRQQAPRFPRHWSGDIPWYDAGMKYSTAHPPIVKGLSLKWLKLRSRMIVRRSVPLVVRRPTVSGAQSGQLGSTRCWKSSISPKEAAHNILSLLGHAARALVGWVKKPCRTRCISTCSSCQRGCGSRSLGTVAPAEDALQVPESSELGITDPAVTALPLMIRRQLLYT
eukprot:4945572-Amphidinium_carterae.3